MKRKLYLQIFAGMLAIYLVLMACFTAYVMKIHEFLFLQNLRSNIDRIADNLWEEVDPYVKEDGTVEDMNAATQALFRAFSWQINFVDQEIGVYAGDATLLFHKDDTPIFSCQPVDAEASVDGWYTLDEEIYYGFLHFDKWFSPEDASALQSYYTMERNSQLNPQKEGDISGYTISATGIWTDGLEIIPQFIRVSPRYVSKITDSGNLGWTMGDPNQDYIFRSTYQAEQPPRYLTATCEIKYPNTSRIGHSFSQRTREELRTMVTDQKRLQQALLAPDGVFSKDDDNAGFLRKRIYWLSSYQDVWEKHEVTGRLTSPFFMVTAYEYHLFDLCKPTLLVVWSMCLLVFAITACLLAHNSWKTYRKLEAVEIRRRQISQALAHDLKTPLATLSGCAENLLAGVHTEKRDLYAQRVWDQTQELDGIVTRMLELSRLEAGGAALRLTQVSMAQLCWERLDRDTAVLREKHLTCSVTGDWILTADRPLMERVIDNFISNALHFTPCGGTITASLSDNAFFLENSGSHIPEKQLTNIWQAYYKADSSQTEEGLGLGLYLSAEILKLHQLSYGAVNTENGVLFSITAPYAKVGLP